MQLGHLGCNIGLCGVDIHFGICGVLLFWHPVRDATVSSPVNRWSFPLQPRNDAPATFFQPAGLRGPRSASGTDQPSGVDGLSEGNGKTSRTSAPARANPSLMQPYSKPTNAQILFTETRRRARVPLMKRVFSSATRSRSDIIPKWADIQTCLITCRLLCERSEPSQSGKRRVWTGWPFTQGGGLGGLALGYYRAAPPGRRMGGPVSPADGGLRFSQFVARWFAAAEFRC
jgi:hypothetical protein